MQRLALAIVLITGVAIACGDSPDLTNREITDSELVAMVLPQEAFGPEYADFSFVADLSGFNSNQDVIDSNVDPDDEEEDIERFGRVSGYGEAYSSPTRASLDDSGVADSTEPSFIGTIVEKYEDQDGASGYFSDDVQDGKDFVGKTDPDGLTLDEFIEFDLDERIADESTGASMALSGVGLDSPLRQSSVDFRRGRLIGSVTMIHFDDEDKQSELEELARKLDERMVAVLEGEVEPLGTPTPRPTATPRPGAELVPPLFLDSFRFEGQMSVLGEDGFVLTNSGEFEAPDRLRCHLEATVRGLKIREEEVVVVGREAWIDAGEGFSVTDTDDPNVIGNVELCAGSPTFFWADFVSGPEISGLGGVAETINGVAGTKYSLGEVFQTLGEVGFLPSELEGVNFDAVEVWLANDGDWIVAFNMDMTADPESASQAFGLPFDPSRGPGRITIRVDITDPNDPSITVDPPAP